MEAGLIQPHASEADAPMVPGVLQPSRAGGTIDDVMGQIDSRLATAI